MTCKREGRSSYRVNDHLAEVGRQGAISLYTASSVMRWHCWASLTEVNTLGGGFPSLNQRPSVRDQGEPLSWRASAVV